MTVREIWNVGNLRGVQSGDLSKADSNLFGNRIMLRILSFHKSNVSVLSTSKK